MKPRGTAVLLLRVGGARRTQLPGCWSCSYDSRSRGVLGTLTYPHLILPYSAYYDHIATHYGGHRCSPIPCWCNKRQLLVPAPPIYGKLVDLKVLSVLTTYDVVWGVSIQSHPNTIL